jgi:hypothetical protein
MREFRFIGAWEPPSRRLSIYRLEHPDVSTKMLLSIASDFGIGPSNTAAVQDLPDQLKLVDGSHVLNVSKLSGALRYVDAGRWQVDDGHSSVSFSDTEAIEQAYAHIDRVGLAGPDRWQPLKVSRLNVAAATRAGGELDQRAIDVSVVFQRLVGDLPVEGPGGKLVVYLDHAGEITGFERIARPLGAVHSEVDEFRSADEMLNEVKRFWGTDGRGRCEVEVLRVGYFEFGRSEQQDLIQPAVMLSLRFVARDERNVHHAQFPVAAAVRSVGPILRPPEPITVQVPRRDPKHG